jgi:hypothetical protein
MDRILEIIFLIFAVSLFVGITALGIYIFVKRRQNKELPEGVSAEPQQPGYMIWTFVFCGLNFITSTINHFKDKESHTTLFNTAYAIFIAAWVLTLILMIVTLLMKTKCSITENGIVVSSGMTTAPSACWYEIEGKKLIITDRKTGYKCTYTVTGDMEKLNEILKASYTRHA